LLTIAGIVESEAAPGPRPEWRSRPVTSWPTSASGPTGSQGSDEGGRIHHALALDEIRGPHAGGQGRVQLVRVGADDRFGRHRLPAGSHLPLDVQMVPRLRWIEPYPDHAALLGL